MSETNRSRPPLLLVVVGLLGLLGLVVSFGWSQPALATTLAQTATAPSLTELVDAVKRTGRYLEKETDASITTAIDRANDEGIAVVWIIGDDTEATAKDLLSLLDNAGSRYHTVVAIGDSQYWAESTVHDPASAADLMVPDLTAGRVANALETFTASVTGKPPPDDRSETPTSDSPTTSTETGSGGGIPWIPVLLVGAAGFFAFRFFSGRSKAKRAGHELIEIDRAEIAEQLKNNADRVIGLGDLVIAKKEPDLIRIYEEASTAYQEVSTELEHATTAEQVNLLDDKIDKAEWQFEVIEARLDGRTPPSAPAPDTDASPLPRPSQPSQPNLDAPGRSTDRPALGRDDSVLGRSGGGRSSGLPGGMAGGMGGMGGGLGGILGGVLGGMLGGGRRPRTTSRRSQQRRQDTGSYGGGLGGGVLRPRSPSRSGSRSSRGGGGNFGTGRPGRRSRGGGGGF